MIKKTLKNYYFYNNSMKYVQVLLLLLWTQRTKETILQWKDLVLEASADMKTMLAM